MSKAISNELKAHLAGQVTTLACCWKITRRDAVSFCFTDHDTDIEYGGNTYISAKGALPSALQQSANLSIDNMEAMTFLDPTTVEEADVMAGLFDYASVDVFIINYEDISQGVLYLAKEWLAGNFTIADNVISAEIRGKAQKLAQQYGEKYSQTCRAILGDSRCGIDLEDSVGTYRHDGTVATVTEARRKFTDETVPSGYDDGTFRYGRIAWSTPESAGEFPGLNAGFSMEIKAFDPVLGEFELLEAMPYTISAGDQFVAYWGCDKSLATCRDTFDNVVNFRGEPYLPGPDKVLKIYGRPSTEG